MEKLYPIKFNPIYKEKIWGGNKLNYLLNKNCDKQAKIGESWEISAHGDDVSLITNGFLAENNLSEIIEIYMGDIVGDRIYEQYGNEFPLLIKFIDANDDLSIQVHPDDIYAKEHHQSLGKTEMWYILQTDEDAELISGFSRKISKGEYIAALNSGKLKDVLNTEKISEGDTFFIPPGRVHAIGSNTLLAEIQQTSDITYRIYDWGRLGTDGKPRELHTNQAIEVIDFNVYKSYKNIYTHQENRTSNILKCPYFTTNILEFNKPLNKDYSMIDSFVIFICVKGSFEIKYNNNKIETVEYGETVLLPAVLKDISLIPNKSSKLLEVYIS